MYQPWKIIDIELNRPLEDIEGLKKYQGIKLFIRLNGKPIGFSEIPIENGYCTASEIEKVILDEHSKNIVNHVLREKLNYSSTIEDFPLSIQFADPIPKETEHLPMVSVVVCTLSRPEDLKLCLDSLKNLDYPNFEILIIDNAPGNDATKKLIEANYPAFRHVCEPRPGLDWARNRGILESQGEIIAFTDDDVIVDPNWISAMVKIFVEDSQVMAVTGLVIPYELETNAQMLFELNGGFGRGFERKWIRVAENDRLKWARFGTGQYGTGANMAYRRNLFEQIGYFDTALDVGTITNGGGDLEMFFRVLKEGHLLVYEPNAIVRHRHRREYPQLKKQVKNNGIGLHSFFVRSALNYSDERFTFICLGLWWMWWWNIRRLLLSFLKQPKVPRDLIWAELQGSLLGLFRYKKAFKITKEINKKFGDNLEPFYRKEIAEQDQPTKRSNAIAIRKVDLSRSGWDIRDVSDYHWVRIFVYSQTKFLGVFDIDNHQQSICRARLSDEIVRYFWYKLVHLVPSFSENTIINKSIVSLKRKFGSAETKKRLVSEKLLPNIPVSIVIATLDRPHELRNCLNHLKNQKTSRKVEIVVVDNNPVSGLTPPVVNEFDDIVLVNEPRKGLAYARNAGFAASNGDILVATDDDVFTPPDWLENLVAPFARSDVMIVTGNTLPYEIETRAQHLFEMYGGLGRGSEIIEANSAWFKSFHICAVPTWNLGATANAAFRATIFNHPRIGLMDETLGPGMPSGVGEDTYLFYKVLKAGYTIIYEPRAIVWHKHRRTISALRSQIFNYGKGHVSYHLTTLLRDHDLRPLFNIFFHLPIWHLKQIIQYFKDLLLKNNRYSLSLILIESLGNLMGPWSLWRSHCRVKREGRSHPYIPISKFILSQKI